MVKQANRKLPTNNIIIFPSQFINIDLFLLHNKVDSE